MLMWRSLVGTAATLLLLSSGGRAQDCHTANAYDSQNGDGQCFALLASGMFACSGPGKSFAFAHKSMNLFCSVLFCSVLFNFSDAISETALFHAVCQLECGVNFYDTQFGVGACATLIADLDQSAPSVCSGVFSNGAQFEGARGTPILFIVVRARCLPHIIFECHFRA
eukprot:SAG31_NODE_5013_length_2801_cov_24.554404_2_plen_168_part_00